MHDARQTREVPREHRPSPTRFRRHYTAWGRPALLTGVASRWPAVSRWSPEFFRKEYPEARVRYIERDLTPPASMLELARGRDRIDARIADLVDRMQDDDGRIRYLIFSDLLQQVPELQRDVAPLDAYQLSPVLPAPLRRRLLWQPLFWMGPRSTASPIHLDAMDNLFVQIHGHKEWLLWPPSRGGDLYFPCADHPDEFLNWSPVDPERPDPARFPRFADSEPLRVTVGPGDVLYIPAGWWHVVRYHEPAISLTCFWYGPWTSTVGCRHFHLERWRRKLPPWP